MERLLLPLLLGMLLGCDVAAGPQAESAKSDTPTDAAPTYGGLTVEAWRERLKEIEPDHPSAARDVPGLIQLIRDGDADPLVRQQGVLILGRIGAPAQQAVPVIVEELLPHPQTRPWALKALAYFGPIAKEAAPKLVEIIKDNSVPEDDRLGAIDALGRLGAGYAGTIPVLTEVLASEGDGYVIEQRRVSAAESLGMLGPAAAPAAPVLLRALEAESWQLRRAAVISLGEMGPRAEIAMRGIVERLVLDEKPEVRDVAGWALASIGSPAIPLLTRLLESDDPEVRWRAVSALGDVGPPARKAAETVRAVMKDEDAKCRLTAIAAHWKLTRDRNAVVEPLLAELANPDRQMRIRAVRLLVEIRPDDRETIGRLERLTGDERPHVRQAAREILKKLQVEE